jgi:RNA polymerase-binding transcription factor DksA
MPDNVSRENLERRRDEILAQLNRVDGDLRIELDRDPEEQSIQIEQDQVAVTMEAQLRRELEEIENQLLEIGDGQR